MDENKKFNNYLQDFKQLSTKEKQDVIFKQLKVLATISNDYCKEIGSNNEIILNKELIDINNGEYNIDDYLEAIITLISSIQNSFCDFHDKMTDIINNITKNL